MSSFRLFLTGSALLVGTTLGAGIFSVPYVVHEAGWAIAGFYLAILSAVIIFVHVLYWQVLAKVHERHRLLGLAGEYLGGSLARASAFIIIVELLLTLVVYLALSGRFLSLLAPGLAVQDASLVFWLLAGAPLLLNLRRFVRAEIVGTILKVGIIVLVLFFVPSPVERTVPAFADGDAFLPFGVLLFALSGWTAIEAIFDWRKKFPHRRFREGWSLAGGTLVAALLYAAFASVILGTAAGVAPDTLSGLTNWPAWQLASLEAFALVAIWSSYLLIQWEIKNLLQGDLGVRRTTTLVITLGTPILLIFAGLDNFLGVIGLVGGVFLSFVYWLILAVARRVLRPSGLKLYAMVVIQALFVLAAVYEVYYFVVK